MGYVCKPTCINVHVEVWADAAVQNHPWIILSPYSKLSNTELADMASLACQFLWRSLFLFSEARIKRRPPSLPAFMLASMNPKCGLHTWMASTLTTEPFPQPHDKVFASNLLLMAVSVWSLFLFLAHCCDLKISSYACHLCFHQWCLSPFCSIKCGTVLVTPF